MAVEAQRLDAARSPRIFDEEMKSGALLLGLWFGLLVLVLRLGAAPRCPAAAASRAHEAERPRASDTLDAVGQRRPPASLDETSRIEGVEAGAPRLAAADDRAASRRRLRKEPGVEAECWAARRPPLSRFARGLPARRLDDESSRVDTCRDGSFIDRCGATPRGCFTLKGPRGSTPAPRAGYALAPRAGFALGGPQKPAGASVPRRGVAPRAVAVLLSLVEVVACLLALFGTVSLGCRASTSKRRRVGWRADLVLFLLVPSWAQEYTGCPADTHSNCASWTAYCASGTDPTVLAQCQATCCPLCLPDDSCHEDLDCDGCVLAPTPAPTVSPQPTYGPTASPAPTSLSKATAFGEVGKLTAKDAAVNDMFGSAVAISGDYAVVGAYGDDDAAAECGAAYVFGRSSGGSWSQVAKLVADDAGETDHFGYAVAISGAYTVVGAHGDDCDGGGVDCGSAFVFGRNSTGSWTQVAKLVADDASGNDQFGDAVAISGAYAVVGAKWHDHLLSDAGCAYVFGRNADGSWSQVAKLVADDASQDDRFGYAVAISGVYAVVGAKLHNHQHEDAGCAYVFGQNANGSWSQVAKLIASDAEKEDYFGTALAISGDYAVIGAAGDDDVGSGIGSSDSGSAYVFHRSADGSWPEVAKLIAHDSANGDNFGVSVAIDGDLVVVGTYASSAYVFGMDAGENWTPLAKLTASDASGANSFGYAVGISGDYVLVGAYQDDDGGYDSGAAYLYLDGECLSGTYITEANVGYVCEACPKGRFNANETNAQTCEPCPINTFSNAGAANCTNCTTGRFAGIGSGSCTFCQSGQYQYLNKSTEKLVCDWCAVGTYSPLGLFCIDCGVGSFTEDGAYLCLSLKHGSRRRRGSSVGQKEHELLGSHRRRGYDADRPWAKKSTNF